MWEGFIYVARGTWAGSGVAGWAFKLAIHGWWNCASAAVVAGAVRRCRIGTAVNLNLKPY
jgi:hypothetical protein